MTLPKVRGWIIDFRTAGAIFESGRNARINHCIQLCESGKLFTCHCEAPLFKAHPQLNAPFVVDQKCIVEPDDDILQRSLSIANNPVAKRRIEGNESAIFITAIAASKTFGVISDHRSPFFSTVYDLCMQFGIPIYSADEYFAKLS